MGREELANTILLTKLRFKADKWKLFFLLTITVIVFGLWNWYPLQQLFDGRPSEIIQFDYLSHFPSFLSIYWFFWLLGDYEKSNQKYASFPQTSSNRFISWQIVAYAGVLLYFGTLSLLYGLLMGFLFLMDKAEYVYAMDFNTFITGLLVIVAYHFLIVAMFSFLKVVSQKYLLIASIVAALFILSLFHSSNLWRFITEEASVSLFFIKVVCGWSLLLALTLWINKKITYYAPERLSNVAKGIVVTVVSILIFGIIIYLPGYEEESTVEKEWHFESPVQKVELDASFLNDYSEIKLVILDETEGINWDAFDEPFSHFLSEIEYETGAPDDKIIVRYELPFDAINGVDILQDRQSLDVFLEGKELRIRYQLDVKPQKIMISPWLFMGQFERYQNEAFFHIRNGYTGEGSTGWIEIQLPENMKVVE